MRSLLANTYLDIVPQPNDLAHVDNDVIVVEDSDITIVFTYPFDDDYSFGFHSEGGFTLRQLVTIVRNKYKEMYQANEASNTIDLSVGRPTLLNIPQTNGMYGVWGHVIDDLCLREIKYDDTTRTITLSIDS